MRQTVKTAFALLLALAGTGCWAQPRQEIVLEDGHGLKDAYRDYFSVGVAVNKRNVSIPQQMALVRQQFNSMTAENDMKPASVHPAEGVWNWGAADSPRAPAVQQHDC